MIPKVPPQNRMREDPLKMTAELRRFHEWVSEKGCCICGKSPCAPHHEPYRSQGGSHKLVAGLCEPDHHVVGPESRHSVSDLDTFNKMHGIDIQQIAIDNWREYNEYS